MELQLKDMALWRQQAYINGQWEICPIRENDGSREPGQSTGTGHHPFV
jgi:hypothetical protein